MRTEDDLKQIHKNWSEKKKMGSGRKRMKKGDCQICGGKDVSVGISHGLDSVCTKCKHTQSRILKFPEETKNEFKRINADNFPSPVLPLELRIKDLEANLDILNTANQDLAQQVMELEAEGGDCKPGRNESQAWDLAKGVITGAIQGVSWENIQTIRDAA